MYFWNVGALADDLKHQNVSELEKFKYFILIVIVCFSGDVLRPYLPDTHPLQGKINFIGMALSDIISIVGTWLCFRTNRNGDNQDFIVRFLCLGTVIGIRMLAYVCVYLLVYGILFGVIFPKFITPYSTLVTLYSVASINILIAINFLWIQRQLAAVAQNKVGT